MKRAAVILLLLVYGATTIGATIYVHYCMDEMAGWSLVQSGGEICGNCGMADQEKEGCCKDKQHHFKLDVAHEKSNSASFQTLEFKSELVFPSDESLSHLPLSITQRFPVSHAPPDISSNRLHLLHCVFLI